jgi:Copper amine oxidase, enzyme domain
VTDTPVERGKAEPEITVKVRPFGPSTDRLAEIGERVVAQARVREFLGRSRARLLYVEALENLDDKPRRPRPPDRFRATIYDDTNHRTVLADGSIDDLRRLTLTESAVPPAPSDAEFAAAVKLVRRDDTLGAAVAAGLLEPYQPIPALHLVELPDGRIRRRIAVGLLPRDAAESHTVVAVDVARREIIRVEDEVLREGGPQARGLCGVPRDANQSTAGKGTAGQVSVTVSQGGQTLWRFLAVRPAASSGTNGSGIELRYVDYMGKRVLYRAHVPILNVKYNANACGPYRDWQYQEGMIQSQGIDVAPGFRFSSGPALTIMDTGSDTGTFLGVGIYILFNEVVFVSEMEAGWYRYITQWRLGTNGTIRPRFGFAAVEHPCVCNVHHHHVYWRLDFDIRTAGNNRVREFNDPPLFGNQNWHTKSFEVRRPRDPGRARRWRVENTSSGEGYDIIPQLDDGLAAAMPDAPFGRGDVWILRYRGSEIDDGVVAIGPPYEADIDRWINGEAISDHDVVVWYGAHFTHDVSHHGPALHGHILGPDLKPVNW